MTSPKPYQIHVPDAELEELQQRLRFTKLPSQLESDDEWQFGVPVQEVKRLLDHWKHGFDWRKHEAELNRLPQFRTEVEVVGFGKLDVHCKQAIDNNLSQL